MSSLFLTKNGYSETVVFTFRDTVLQIKQAAVELVRAVKLISGADIDIVNDKTLSDADGTMICLSTFSENPELKQLFPEDFEYLLGSDGFAVRRKAKRIYVFSHLAEGVFFGVHSFLEENAGIIWTRGKRGFEQVFRSRNSIEIKKCDYHEKSPFKFRGWHSCGRGEEGMHLDAATMRFLGKNRNNCKFFSFSKKYIVILPLSTPFCQSIFCYLSIFLCFLLDIFFIVCFNMLKNYLFCFHFSFVLEILLEGFYEENSFDVAWTQRLSG